jgi:glycosyltransferase involved in cell wall biosynthesis
MKFSLLLPTYNRSQQLAVTLPFLEKLRYPVRDFEVIVIDNNSTDSTKKVVQEFISSTQLNVRYAFEKKQGRTFASRKGFRLAKSDKIVFIDDDIAVQPKLLQIYQKYYLKYPQAVVVGGEILASFTDKKVREKLITRYVLNKCPWVFGQVQHGNKAKFLGTTHAAFAGNMSICLSKFSSPSEIFDSFLGRPFQGNYYYGEDYELCLRLHAEKKKILFVPELSVENCVDQDRLTWKFVWKRHFNGGTERYIIDQRLKKFAGYQGFPHKFEDLLTDFSKAQSVLDKIDWLFSCVYWWGYTQKGPKVYNSLLKENV